MYRLCQLYCLVKSNSLTCVGVAIYGLGMFWRFVLFQYVMPVASSCPFENCADGNCLTEYMQPSAYHHNSPWKQCGTEAALEETQS